MAFGTSLMVYLAFILLCFKYSNDRFYFQDISPNYYDISTFPKGDMRSALLRAADRLARKEKMRADAGKRR